MTAPSLHRLTLSWRLMNRLSLITALAILITGCVTTSSPSSPPPPLSQVETKDFGEIDRPETLGGAGAIAISYFGSKQSPFKYSLNNVPIGTYYDGYVWLPVLPATYSFRFEDMNKSWEPMSVRVLPGKTTYVVIDTSIFRDTPYEIGDRSTFDEQLDNFSNPSVRVIPDNPLHAYLPPNKKALAEGCTAQTAATNCKRALTEIPKMLIATERRKEISALVAAYEDKQAALAAAKPQKPAAPTPATRAASSPTVNVAAKPKPPQTEANSDLPLEIQRDQFVIQISDLFKEGKLAEALPYFAKLNALPVPIDPATDFYWAQAMHANGDTEGAYRKLTRFVKRITASSRYYQPAIRLLTKIKG